LLQQEEAHQYNALVQWFPTFFDAFLPLLISELFIPPLWNFHSSPVRVCRLVFGTMVFINERILINKSGTKIFATNIGTKVFQQKRVIVH